ncbi:MAG: hypothetical protein EON98_15170 [Chitinophagaceae bacterium]|nr:MAG: hypothetical protein EON98_15170 [Chitinophagaceae bacterium]
MTTVIRSTKTIALWVFHCVFAFSFSVVHAGGENPFQQQAELLQQQIARYADMQKRGGWGKLLLNKKQYKAGEKAPFVAQVKKRLQVCGDLDGSDTTSLFTPELEAAVKKAQHRFGFKETGLIDNLLISSLNVPVEQRIQQLQINLDRARTMNVNASGRRIVVNIPEYKLHVYEGATHVFDMNVVVGSETHRTAIFDDELTHVVFSPYWNVPQSIVQNEILPAMRRNRRYLSSHGYEQIGTENGLPKSEPAKLANYLLKDDPNWTAEKIEDAMNAGKEQWVKLSAVVPVSIIYLTAWVDHEGVLNFRDDVYEMDNSLPVAANIGF